VPNSLRTLETTSWDVIPAGLSKSRRPSGSDTAGAGTGAASGAESGTGSGREYGTAHGMAGSTSEHIYQESDQESEVKYTFKRQSHKLIITQDASGFVNERKIIFLHSRLFSAFGGYLNHNRWPYHGIHKKVTSKMGIPR
jgi:hypothetical protein